MYFSLRNLKTLFKSFDGEDFNKIEANLQALNKPQMEPIDSINTKKGVESDIKINEIKNNLDKNKTLCKKIFYPFDLEYYISQLKDKNLYKSDSEYNFEHYVKRGYKLNLSPCVLFDQEYYKSQIREKIESNPFEHYLKNISSNIFISPHPLIDVSYIISKGIISKVRGNNIIEKIINYYEDCEDHFQSTCPIFAAQWYAELNDLEFKNPLINYLKHNFHNGHPLSIPHIYYDLVNKEENYLCNIVKSIENYEKCENPDTSIVILNWNKSILTIQCVATIVNNTSYEKFEIIIVDNGSNPEDYSILRSYLKEKCIIIRNLSNRYFGEANNIAVEFSKCNNIVFLNNDAFVQKSWLSPLISLLNSKSDCGGVGSLLLFPNGLIQESGGQINLDGVITQENKGRKIHNYANLIERKTEYKSAASFAMKKDLFLRLGGFDYIYEPAYFEDTDLCMKIRSIGLHIYSCPSSLVTHVENLTSKSDGIGFDFMSNVSLNRKKFSDRWDLFIKTNGMKGKIKRDYSNFDLIEKSSFKDNEIAFVYTPYDLIQGGGEKYILFTICALIEKGYSVYLLTEKEYSNVRLFNLFNDLNLDLSYIKSIKLILFNKAIAEFKRPKLFISMGNTAFPDKLALGNQINMYHCQFPFPISSPEFIIRAEQNIYSYDKVIVNSHFTKENLKRVYENQNISIQIEVVKPPVHIYDVDHSKFIKSKYDILSVGRFFVGGHNKNHKFMIDAFKKLQKLDPKFRLHLVGGTSRGKENLNHLKNLMKLAKDFNVDFYLDASSDKVIELYSKCSVYWHATGFGVDYNYEPELLEHFGMTIVEAINFGLYPIVYEQGGPAEQIKEYNYGILYKNEEELISKTLDYFNNSAKIVDKELNLPSKQLFIKSFSKLIDNKV